MSDNILKKMPLKSLAKLVEAHYAAVIILETALRDVPHLPREPYQNAHSLFATQLNTLLAQYEKRTNSTRTQKLVDQVVAACMPPKVEEAPAPAEAPNNG